MHNIDGLDVYRRARRLVRLVYEETRSFPADERYLLVSQMRSCAISIGANLKEGSGRNTPGEFRQFVGYACGSTCELEWHALISSDLGYLSPERAAFLMSEVIDVKKMLYRFNQALRRAESASGPAPSSDPAPRALRR